MFSSNSTDNEIKRGERVRIRYAGIEGIVVSVDNRQVMIAYQNEQDKEIIKTYSII